MRPSRKRNVFLKENSFIKKSKNQEVPSGEPLDLKESKVISITIRTGRGVNLGSHSSEALRDWVVNHRSMPQYSFSVEGTKLTGHWQGAMKFDEPVKVRNVKSYLLELYKKNDPEWTDKNSKYAIEVKPHDNWQGLLSYTHKERLPEFHSINTDDYYLYTKETMAGPGECPGMYTTYDNRFYERKPSYIISGGKEWLPIWHHSEDMVVVSGDERHLFYRNQKFTDDLV